MDIDLYTRMIELAGGVNALAEHLDQTATTVSNWRKREVPPIHCRAIEALTGISVKELRPDDWHKYWPELAEAGSAA